MAGSEGPQTLKSMTTDIRKCCYIGSGDVHCADAAEFVIHEHGTTYEHNPDGSGSTEACAKHVGKLLSYAGELVEGQALYWTVYPL